MTHSFLLIGQSNMAGRGFINDVPAIQNNTIKVLRNGRWQIMSEPIHNDRPTAGIGLASSFALAWKSQNKDLDIGLIPCADGGTSLEDWSVGGLLFDHAVAQAKLAMRTSQISGILWHQGENDSAPQLAQLYYEKFENTVTELRLQLDLPHVPLIIGGLGDFLTSGVYGQYFSDYSKVNSQLLQYAESNDNCYYATAENLTANEDQIHFNAKSLRLLGIRYYEAYSQSKNIISPLLDENEILEKLIYTSENK